MLALLESQSPLAPVQTHLSCSNKLLIIMCAGEEGTEILYGGRKMLSCGATSTKSSDIPPQLKEKADRQAPLSAPARKQPAQTSAKASEVHCAFTWCGKAGGSYTATVWIYSYQLCVSEVQVRAKHGDFHSNGTKRCLRLHKTNKLSFISYTEELTYCVFSTLSVQEDRILQRSCLVVGLRKQMILKDRPDSYVVS